MSTPITINTVADGYLDHLRTLVSAGQREPATAAWYELQYRKLRRVAGDLPAADLRTHHLAGVPFTYQFVRAVKSLTRWAVDEDLLSRDPLKKLRVPKCGQRTRTITRPELARLCRSACRPLRLMLFFLRYTIARPGEVRRLRWAQVDLATKVIRLRKFKGQKVRRDNLAERVIPLADPLVRMLATWQGRRNPQPTDPVFGDRRGRERTGNAFRCMVRRARASAGLVPDANGERVVAYTLRHTGATNAVRNGMPQMTLARVMGHAKLDTTNRYVHLAEQDLVDAIGQATGRRRLSA